MSRPYDHIKFAAKLKAKDLLDMESGEGALVDYWPATTWNQAGEGGRPGRATAMAESVGEDPGFLVNYPLTSGALASLLGAAVGGGLGFGSGAFLRGQGVDIAPEYPTAGGILAGMLAGSLTASGLRRSRMKEIAKAFDAKTRRTAKDHDPNPGDLLGGTHNYHRQKAIQAIRGQMSADEATSYGASPYLAAGLPLLGGPLAGPLTLISYPVSRGVDNIRALMLREEKKTKNKKKK